MIISWQERWQRALKEKHQLLFDYNSKTLKEQFAQYVACPVCNTEAHEANFFFEKDMFYYFQCKNCLLVFMNPRLNEEATAAFYNSDVNAIYNETKFDTVTDRENPDDQINDANFHLMTSLYADRSRGNLLEIGCAKGYFLLKAKNAGFNVWGLELNKKNCNYARSILGDNIINNDLIDTKFDNHLFDFVYMRDVIEHLPKPREIFTEINRILKINGILFVETHNIDGFIHLITRNRHTCIFGFEHPVHYSPKSIGYLFDIRGLRIDHIYFQSMDFTVNGILSYFGKPTFTTIMPKKVSKVEMWFFKLLRKPFTLFPLKQIDAFLPQIANKLGRGSTMKVFARKMNDI